MCISYAVTRHGPRAGRDASAESGGPVLVPLGRGLLPVGLELAISARMAVNTSARYVTTRAREVRWMHGVEGRLVEGMG